MLFQSTNEAINELNTTQKSAVLHADFNNPAWQLVPRHGDVLLGLYLDAAATRTLVVTMVIGGMTVGKFRIEPGTKVLAFLGVSYLSLLALCYHEVSYRYDYEPGHLLQFIFGHIGADRQAFSQKACLEIPLENRDEYSSSETTFLYTSGLGGLVAPSSDQLNGSYHQPSLKDVTDTKHHWRKLSESVRERLYAIEEELMQVTWNPAPLEHCLDRDERCACHSDMPDMQDHVQSCESSSIWFDEILICDNCSSRLSSSPGIVTRSLTKSDQSISFVHSSGRHFCTIRGKPGRMVMFDGAKPCFPSEQC